MQCFACNGVGHFKGSQTCKANKRKAHRRTTRRVEPSSESETASQCSSISEETLSTSSSDSRRKCPSERKQKARIHRVVGHRIKIHRATHQRERGNSKNSRYQVRVVIKEHVVPAFADTGADINVMSRETAAELGLQLVQTKTKVRPYGSKPLKCSGYYEGSVTFGDAFAAARFYVIKGNVETLLSGGLCEALGIIKFNSEQKYSDARVHRIKFKDSFEERIVTENPTAFQGIGTLRDYQVNFHIDKKVPPVAQPARPIPLYLRNRFEREVEAMQEQDVIEEHHGPAPWISNPVSTLR